MTRLALFDLIKWYQVLHAVVKTADILSKNPASPPLRLIRACTVISVLDIGSWHLTPQRTCNFEIETAFPHTYPPSSLSRWNRLPKSLF